MLHAERVLPAVYEFMGNDGSIEETLLPAVVSSNQQVTRGDWDGLKKGRISSHGDLLGKQILWVYLWVCSLPAVGIHPCAKLSSPENTLSMSWPISLARREMTLPTAPNSSILLTAAASESGATTRYRGR